MSQVYSGGPIINAVFTATTKVDIVDNLKNELVNATWTVVSGSSGDWTLQSATTPQSLGCRIRIYDPSGGNVCARITVMNQSGGITGTAQLFLYPSGNDWRIIANPYQFFIQEDNSPTSTNRRDFACVGSPWVPSFPGITECVWSSSRSWNDTTNADMASFRQKLTANADGLSNTGNYVTILNGSMAYAQATFLADAPGILTFRIGTASYLEPTAIDVGSCQFWYDNTKLMDTPYICFGSSGSSDPATINGVVWDAVIVEGAYSYGSTFNFDSKDWFAITHNNQPSSGNKNPGGTLFVRIT